MRLILALLFASTLGAQIIWQLPLWSGKSYSWLNLGPSFVVRANPDGSGTIDVLPAPSVAVHQHVTGAVLTAANGVYTIPANAVNVTVYRNNFRMTPGGDYELAAGVIKPMSIWGPVSLVLVDYVIP